MYWMERIAKIQKNYTSVKFNDPFYNGKVIIKDIIEKFHNVKPIDFYRTENKETVIKKLVFIKECSVTDLYEKEINKLKLNTNYYLLLLDIVGETWNDCIIQNR